MSNISIQHLNKHYGDVQVLHDINLELADNSFVVFVGPSGCGKSTLLRTIAGLETQSSGQILMDGKDITKAPPVDRDVAMVFQNYALYPQMTVRDNIGFALSVAGVPKSEIRKRVDEAATLLKLDGLLERKPKDLSGGQRQRVAIGRAILRNPKAFLFDEPLSNLDAELRVDMRLQIAELRSKLSATFIYVTHDQVEAMTLADKIVVLRKGVIEQVGAPMELYHSPANMFVAGFIGSPKMNFIAATMGQNQHVTLADGVSIAAPNIPLPPGAKLTVGVRPEAVEVSDDGPLKAVVAAIENLGAVSYAHCRIASDELVTLQLSPHHSLAKGMQIALGFKPSGLFFFDENEVRIKF